MLAVLLGLVSALFLANAASQAAQWTGVGGVVEYTFAPLFSFDGESTVPAYVSSLLLLAASVLLYVAHRAEDGERYGKAWLVLALVFLWMAVDEGVGIHEYLHMPVASRVEAEGWFRFAWVIPVIPLVAAFGLYMTPFLLRLPARTRTLFVVSGALFVAGALGFEMLSGRFGVGGVGDGGDLVYRTLMTVEETLEMVGVSLFIYAIVRHLAGLRVEATAGFARGDGRSTVSSGV